MQINKLVKRQRVGVWHARHRAQLVSSRRFFLKFFGFGKTEGGDVMKLVLNTLDCLQAGGLIVGCEILDSLAC